MQRPAAGRAIRGRAPCATASAPSRPPVRRPTRSRRGRACRRGNGDWDDPNHRASARARGARRKVRLPPCALPSRPGPAANPRPRRPASSGASCSIVPARCLTSAVRPVVVGRRLGLPGVDLRARPPCAARPPHRVRARGRGPRPGRAVRTRSAAGRRTASASPSRLAAARRCRSSRQRSISSAAAGGGGRPVSFSRTSSAMACAMGEGRAPNGELPVLRDSESLSAAVRFCATPASTLPPRDWQRMSSTASKISLARAAGGPEAGVQHRIVVGAAQRQVIGVAADAGGIARGQRPGDRRQAQRGGGLAGHRRAEADVEVGGARERPRRLPQRALADFGGGLRRPGGAACSHDLHARDRLRQLGGKRALVELGHRRPLEFVALVEERHAERAARRRRRSRRSRPR